MRHFGIDAQHVLAFGDNENDMDMLRHAGVSVAMGNANREVQQVATMVTSSNKEGGVAAALPIFNILRDAPQCALAYCGVVVTKEMGC